MSASVSVSQWKRRIFLNIKSSRLTISHHCRNLSKKSQKSFQLATTDKIIGQPCVPARRVKVGIVFDIDGVLLRGRNVIPTAQNAIHKLKDNNIPFIYLTNGGCETEEQKAEKLKERLGVEVLSRLLLSFVFFKYWSPPPSYTKVQHPYSYCHMRNVHAIEPFLDTHPS